ncbi:MAG: hypothetical protein V1490_00165 [Candidatus Omnitrophota bacterium]
MSYFVLKERLLKLLLFCASQDTPEAPDSSKDDPLEEYGYDYLFST